MLLKKYQLGTIMFSVLMIMVSCAVLSTASMIPSPSEASAEATGEVKTGSTPELQGRIRLL